MNISAHILTSVIADPISHNINGSQLIYIGFGIGLVSGLLCASIIAYSKYYKRVQSVNKCETLYCEDDDTIIKAVIQVL